mmetsp:Transcript_29794/g.43938  ORF Transcript_29794/g.43938 Transcript_29794/m.43938 type:complete len:259 (-) Transcript_29794:219-995(-)|eukprot:CAMPEP_0194047114 /NCGR_PEP_ID=MMETSP0009_2-20130614/23564_1 /TAXON_ID=210454 /ORGANISM="Grammatophora oceanica, Strain CCMP 410" /LENGTH=258 /DNA_ID=CAMNT_0038692631 /DNA_START=42 /DNA_END=818 /DNA_ORIENTATION=+
MKLFSLLFLGAALLESPLFISVAAKKGKKGTKRRERQCSTAVTLWMVAFNTPGGCVGGVPGSLIQCSPADVFGQAYLDSVAAGSPNTTLLAPNGAANIGVVHVAGGLSKADGDVFINAAIYRQLTDGALELDDGMDPMNLNRGWYAQDAEIHFVIRTHGAVVFQSDGYLDQLLNFLEPYCNDPNLDFMGSEAGATGNVCADIQIIETPADATSGEFPVRWLDGSGDVVDARATFKRRGDGIQIVVCTNVRDNNIFGTS